MLNEAKNMCKRYIDNNPDLSIKINQITQYNTLNCCLYQPLVTPSLDQIYNFEQIIFTT